MYCHQCGVEIPEQSRFCSSCGAELVARARPRLEAVRDEARGRDAASPLVTLAPVFVPGLQLLRQGLFALFFAVWGGGFFGGFAMLFLQFFDLGVPTWAPFAFFGAVFAVGLPLWSFRATRKTYERTRYTFHANKLDYYEGFFTVEEKTIPLDRVTEVHLSKGPMQSKHDLGTILLSTPATSAGSGRASAGIRLLDIAEPDATYRRVKELVERSRSRSLRAAA